MLTKSSHHDIGIITSYKPLCGKVLFASKIYTVDTMIVDGGIYAGPDFFSLIGAVSALCITHPHPDHIGYAAYLRERLAIPVFVSSKGLSELASPMIPPLPIRLVVPTPRPCEGSECPSVIHGDKVDLVALNMPGHTDDHLCFHDEENARAFTGDLLLWGSSPWVGRGVNMELAIESLQRLAELDLDFAYPGHGKPIRNPNTVIEEKVGSMRAFGKKVYALHDKGASEREIQIRLLGHEGRMFYFSNRYFSKRNLIRSYLRSRD